MQFTCRYYVGMLIKMLVYELVRDSARNKGCRYGSRDTRSRCAKRVLIRAVTFYNLISIPRAVTANSPRTTLA